MDLTKLSDEELLKLAEQSEIDSQETQPSMDLSSMSDDELLQMAGIPTPAKGPSQAEALAIGAQQGATLGFGEEAVAGIDALVETMREKLTGATTLAPGEGIKAKYGKSLEQQRGKIEEAEKAFPMTTLGGKLVGGAPAAFATGAGGLIRQAATSGAMGGVQSLGEAEDFSAESLKKAGKTSLFSAGLTGLLGGGIKLVKGMLKTPAGAFKISEELKQSVAKPEVARAVGAQIDDVGARFGTVVQETKDTVGSALDDLAGKIDADVVPDDVFNNTVSKLNAFKAGRNEVAQNAKDDLIDTIKNYAEDFKNLSQTDGKFKALHNLKQQFGQEVFEQGRFSQDKYVDKLAKGLYRDMSATLKKADPTKEYSNLSEVYKHLAGTDPEAFSAKALEIIDNPFNPAVRKAYNKFAGAVDQLDEGLKKQYLGKLQSFMDTDFTDAAFKQQILNAVSGRSSSPLLRNLPAQGMVSQGVSMIPQAAAKAGEMYGKAPSLARGAAQLGAATLEGVGRGAAIRGGSTLGERF